MSKSSRPLLWEEYVGQEEIKKNMIIYCEAALSRRETLDHALFYGPPGLGKTTIASIIAAHMGSKIVITSAPAIEKAGELASILTDLEPGSVLFIDEIHRLDRQVEEMLYSAMEDYRLDILIGAGGEGSRAVSIELEEFTLIGATTRAGMLSQPLKDRFGIQCRMKLYSEDELSLIIKNAAKKSGVEISNEASLLLAQKSRATPRKALSMLNRSRDYAHALQSNIIDAESVELCMSSMGIDAIGLTELDRGYLDILRATRRSAMGLKAISAALNEDIQTVENDVEPFLIIKGLIDKTERGRSLTEKATNYLDSNVFAGG